MAFTLKNFTLTFKVDTFYKSQKKSARAFYTNEYDMIE